MMRWIKRIIISLFSLFVLLTVAVTIITYNLDDDDYRAITLSMIEKYTELNITINGSFSIEPSLNPKIKTSTITIRHAKNNYTLEIDSLKFNVNLKSLLYDNLWVKNLELENVTVTLNQSLFDDIPEIKITKNIEEVDVFKLPIFEHILVQNFTLLIEQKTKKLFNFASITQLKLELDEKKNQHILNGNGLINGYSFDATGSMGNLSNLLIQEAFPINAFVKLANLKLKVNGDIQQILSGSGVNLKIEAKTHDYLKAIRNNKNKLPFIGSMSAHANVTGNLPNVAIKNINFEINNLDKTQITLKGKIPEIMTGKDTHLELTSKINDPEIYTWLFPQFGKQIKTFSASTIINNNSDGNYILNSIKIKSTLADNLKLNASGSAEIKNISKYPFKNINLKLNAQAPNTKSLEFIIDKPLPKMKDIRLTANLYNTKKIYSLKNIALSVGGNKNPELKATGKIYNIMNLDGLSLNSRLNIKTKKLMNIFFTNKEILNMGTTKVKFVLNKKNNLFSLDDFDANIYKSKSWEITAKGNITELLSEQKIYLKTTSRITDWTNLKNVLDIKQRGIAPETGSGFLTGDNNKLKFNNTFRIGKSKFNLHFSLSKPKDRYSINTSLNSKLVHLNDFGIKPKEIKSDNKATNTTNEELISKKTIPFDKLNTFDLISRIKIDKITGGSMDLVGLDVKLNLNKGNLRIHPAKLNYRNGSVKLDLGLKGYSKHEAYLKLNINDFDLGIALSEFQKTPILKGSLSSIVNLQSSGDSLNKIISNSKGDISIVGENVEVLRKFSSLLVSDTLGWATSSIGLKDNYSKWNCSIFKFNIADKKIKSDAILVDGPDIFINGDLSINLMNETIDMSLWPKPKNSIWLNITPVTLKGPIRNPKVNTISVGTSNAARTYGELILAPQIFIPLRALSYINTTVLDFSKNKSGPCQELEKKLSKNKVK